MTHRLDLGAQTNDRANLTGSRSGPPHPAVNIYQPPTYFRTTSRAQLIAMGPVAVTRTRSKNHSFFAIDQIRMFSERLHALVGVRYDDLDVQGTNTTPQFGLTARVRPGVNVFAVYSESFNPNAPRVRSATGEVFTFPPEHGRGVDVGVKLNLFDARLSATLAGFSVTKQNVVQSQATAVPGFTLFMLSGEEKSEGVEFDLAARVSPNYELVASYAYTDARITQSNSRSTCTTLPTRITSTVARPAPVHAGCASARASRSDRPRPAPTGFLA